MSAALEVTGLQKRFGGLPAVDDLTFSVAPGERHLILGPNGAGKTTLFNLITGDLSPTQGEIRVFGTDLNSTRTHERVKLGLARTYQVLTLFGTKTLLQNVMLALNAVGSKRYSPWRRFAGDPALEAQAMDALKIAGLEQLALRFVEETSYGDRRRLELAMALSQRPKLLLLDEPLAGLSRSEREIVRRILDGIAREVTVLMIEHDMEVALEYAERITVLHHGRLVVTGTRKQVVDDQRTREIYLGE